MARRITELLCGSRLFQAAVVLWTIAAVAAALAILNGGTGRAANAAPALTFRLDHFQCYRLDPLTSFKSRGVVLVDQFGRSKAAVTQFASLCAPTRKNNGVVRNRLAHLVCYTIRRSGFRTRRVAITNQFEKASPYFVVRPAQLCLPSGKSLIPGPAPRPVKGLDHYQCYLVKQQRAFKARRVVLVDQFGKSRPTVVRPLTLCAPVSKNRSVIRNKRDHLVCYQLRPAQQFNVRRVQVENQFGAAKLAVVEPQTLCVPSLKRVIPTLPDLTVAIANARTPVNCPGGFGTCLTTVNFTVSNPSAVSVTAPFDVLVETDPSQTKTVSVPSLAAGASTTLSVILGPGGNCYDPDCTVRVTVDSGNVISESNETNNTDTRTDRG